MYRRQRPVVFALAAVVVPAPVAGSAPLQNLVVGSVIGLDPGLAADFGSAVAVVVVVVRLSSID